MRFDKVLEVVKVSQPQGKHICCWERENPHRCIMCCECGKKAEIFEVDLHHSMSCPALNPMSEDDCTCGLVWRSQLRTEQEMHNAWRKRAEEAEAREAELLEMGQAMFHALRSYEYGNASPDLAAEACTKYAQRWVETL